MNIGIIGLGRLGAALARGLDRFWDKGDIWGCNRDAGKAEAVAALASRLRLCASSAEVFERCDPVFLWTKPADALAVLEENRELVRRADPLVVSCVTHTEFGRYCARWAETLPNVNLPAREGVTLVWYPPELKRADRLTLEGVLCAVGNVYELPRDEIPYYSALASCGPALYAVMLEELADALAARRGYDGALCRQLVRETARGTVALQELDRLDARGLVERVAHPGGSSEAGSQFLREKLPGLFEEMLKKMGKW
jgi:pyrroline-5-carboxylate reductase